MSKSSYQLMQDTLSAINRLEDKVDKRLVTLEKRMDRQESKLDNLLGKVGIGVVIFMAFVGGVVAWFFEQFKK